MQRFYPVVRVLSLVILMFGLTMLVPLGSRGSSTTAPSRRSMKRFC